MSLIEKLSELLDETILLVKTARKRQEGTAVPFSGNEQRGYERGKEVEYQEAHPGWGKQ